MKGGSSAIEVKVMSPNKSHHNTSRVGEEDECFVNVVLDVRRGGSLLLEESLVRLHKGRTYALVGNNGVGKSTLLTALRDTFSDRVFLLSQFHEDEEKGENEESASALDYVMGHDTRLERVRDALETCEAAQITALANEEALLEENARERAVSCLQRVGFKRTMREQRAMKQLSGGWRMKARLAVALNANAQIVLLDEPTTSLDVQGIGLLEDAVAAVHADVAFVIVSHNRAFLERTCSDVLLFQQHKLEHFPMSFESFWQVTDEKRVRKQRLFDKQEAKEKQLKQQIAALQSAAAKGQDKAAGAIGARKKKLEQLEAGTCNKHENGKRYHRFSNKTFFYKYGPNVSGKLQPPVLVRPPRFHLSCPAGSGFHGEDVLLSLSDAKIGFEQSKVLKQFDSLVICNGTKLLIEGPNGSGKSTLLRSMTGDLPLLAGTRTLHRGVRIGVYSQLEGEKLGAVAANSLQYIMQQYQMTEVAARDALAQFGISGDVAALPVASLSGGQRARLVFAKLNVVKPHILFLDEPETHLDLLTIAQLADCLSEWSEGAFVMITHDEYLAELCIESVSFE